MNGHTSGAISLDLSALTGAILKGLEPVVGQVNDNLERLAGLMAATALDEDSAVATLTCHLPGPYADPACFPNARAVAEFQAEHLAQAGYALVAVAGPALEAEVRRNGFRAVVADVAPVVDPTTAQAIREDEWFADGRND